MCDYDKCPVIFDDPTEKAKHHDYVHLKSYGWYNIDLELLLFAALIRLVCGNRWILIVLLFALCRLVDPPVMHSYGREWSTTSYQLMFLSAFVFLYGFISCYD